MLLAFAETMTGFGQCFCDGLIIFFRWQVNTSVANYKINSVKCFISSTGKPKI